jgi:hypothetical protein
VFDPDPVLRRIERDALLFCALAAFCAWVVRRGNPDVALGVLGGGGLIALSYWAIRSGATGLVALLTRSSAAAAGRDDGAASAPRKGSVLLRVIGRYALLGLIAYGMIARLRWHPVGLLIGDSSIFFAISFEALRATGVAAARRRSR